MAPIPVTVLNFRRAETDLMFARLAAPVGVGEWAHTRELSPLDEQPVIRQNRDTLYSSAVVDVRDGVTITLPDTGGRYISVWVVGQDHYGVAILTEPGDHQLTRDQVGTDYAILVVRILVDPNDADDLATVHALQDAVLLTGGGSGAYPLPDYDTASHTATRNALLELARGVGDYAHAFGTADEVDPVRHLLGTASGWGGLPEYEATYLSFDTGLPVGEYQLRLIEVPVDAFWSISLYNAEGYFEINELGANSVNSVTATPDADGAVTIRFGTELDGATNPLPIMTGWNYLLRLYRPRAEVLDGTWVAPEVEAL